jgi:pilus assembly protein FimV
MSALPAGAYAATLGKLTVLSAIGQPLNAEVELLSVGPQEKQSLAVKLAPQQAFSQANVEYNPALGTLRFAIEARGNGQVVHITSADGFNEPFVDALLELSGPNTPRAVREYSFLLDPPRGSKENTAQVALAAGAADSKTAQAKAAPKAEAKPEAKPEAKAESKSKAEPKAEPKAAKAPKSAKARSASSEYKIKQGDSLSAIANRMRPAGVSLDQMLVAMYRANPDAFAGDNMSRMRAGKVLSIPDAATAAAVEKPEANAIVVAQAQDFNTYRNQLAGHVASGSAKKAGTASQTASGKITAKVEERSTPAGEAKDKLQLSKGGAGDGMTSEDKIAADKAASDAASRIKDLEKNVNDLQKLLEIKNQNLAELNAKKADAAPAPAPAVAAAATTPAAIPPAAPAADAAATAAATPAPDATPAPATPEASATPAVAPTTPASEAPAAETTPAAPPKPVLAAPVPKPNFFEGWRDNPMLLPGGGLLAVVLLAWAAYRARRKAAPGPLDPNAEQSPIVPPETPKEEAVVAPIVAPVVAAPEPEPIVEAPVEPPAPVAPVAVEPVVEAPIMADPLFASDETAALEAAQKEAAEQQAKSDAEEALNIDLSRLEEPAAPASVATPVPPPLDMSKLDFDLELDQDNKDLPPETGEAVPDIDLAAELAAQSAAKSIGTMDEPPLEPKAAPVAVPAPAPEAPAILPPEIEGLNLDLGEPAEGKATADAASAEEEEEDETSSFAKEINTKIDLAAAYQEIGDKDGARELLEEVVKSGNRRQVAKAQEMLEQLV